MDKREIAEMLDQVSDQKQAERLRNKIILIYGVGQDGKLRLSDKGKTEAFSLDQITWVVVPGFGVRKITGISPKSHSENVFIDGPAALNSTGNIWTGTLKQVVGTMEEEEYKIEYTMSNGDTDVHDPIIQVNPEPPLT